MKIWLEGNIVNPEAAKISVLDHGLLYGDGVFEGIRARLGRVIDLSLHLERLERSARAIYLDIGFTHEQLSQIVVETLRANQEADAYVRLVVTRGEGPLGLDTSSCRKPQVICIVDRIQLYKSESQSAGLSLVTASWRRPDPDVLDPTVKSLNYLNNVLNKYEAKQRGADEALVLNRRGTVAEASGANLFIRDGNTLATPPTADGALPGITRRRLLTVAPSLGLQVVEKSLTRTDVLAADEVFLTGTGAGVVRVGSLDGQSIPRPSDSCLDRITRAMDAYVLTHGTPLELDGKAA